MRDDPLVQLLDEREALLEMLGRIETWATHGPAASREELAHRLQTISRVAHMKIHERSVAA
jgi:hypothetical protein